MPSPIRVLSSLSRDYAHGAVLPEADVATFAHAGGSWYRDAQKVYFYEKPMAGVDLATFRVVSHDEAEDRFGRLRGGVRVSH